MNIDYVAIGKRIKERRKSMGKTQDNLAEKLCVSVGYISQIERGVAKVNLSTLSKIGGFLDCDAVYLLSGVVTGRGNYLDDEIAKLSKSLNAKQKRILIKLAEIIKEEE